MVVYLLYEDQNKHNYEAKDVYNCIDGAERWERWQLSGNTLDCRSRGCGFESHPRQKFYFCRALALRFYSGHSVKWVPANGGRVFHIELGLKIRVYVLRCLAVVSECTSARVETDSRPTRNKQHTNTGIAYADLIAPHSCDYIGYVRHVGHAARSSKKSHVINWARIRQSLTAREVE